jgi:LPPG:FO 2-phospho-L-lactate transferase
MLEALAALGGEHWFRLGDRDLATHLLRTELLRRGEPLAGVTAHLCSQLGVKQRLLPMSDHPVRTVVETELGELPFQEYFVREQCAPRVSGFRFAGIEQARPQEQLLELLASGGVSAIIICPSNPFVSVDPVLSLPGLREAVLASGAPVYAVSPIVDGIAIKGPAAKMMAELGLPVTAGSVADHYRGLVNTFVLDEGDATLAPEIEDLGMDVVIAPTIMKTLADRERLARRIIEHTEE